MDCECPVAFNFVWADVYGSFLVNFKPSPCFKIVWRIFSFFFEHGLWDGEPSGEFGELCADESSEYSACFKDFFVETFVILRYVDVDVFHDFSSYMCQGGFEPPCSTGLGCKILLYHLDCVQKPHTIESIQSNLLTLL